MNETTNGTGVIHKEKMTLCGIYFKTMSLSYATQSTLNTITNIYKTLEYDLILQRKCNI